MTNNSKMSTVSAKDVLSPGLLVEIQRELGTLCNSGCRVYVPATQPQRIWRGKRLTQKDREEIIKRHEDGEAVVVIAEAYKKSASYIHRLIAKHREDKGNGQPNQKPTIQGLSSPES